MTTRCMLFKKYSVECPEYLWLFDLKNAFSTYSLFQKNGSREREKE